MQNNQLFFPGDYLPWEQPEIQPRLDFAANFTAHVPGDADACEIIDERAVLEFNKRWNPYDPLYNDPDYARAQGLPGVPVMPGFTYRKIDPRDAANRPLDRRMASQFYYTALGGDLYYHKRFCSGERVRKFQSGSAMRDVTAPGSDLRVFDFDRVMSIYDEAGRETDRSVIYTREGYHKFIDGRPAVDYTQNMAEWESYFPPARYTDDDDYLRMKRIWDAEKIQGETPLYWEDVAVGTEIPKTCTAGPVTYMHLVAWEPIPPEYLFTREELLDRDYTATVYRDRFGSFLDETAVHFGGRNNPGTRMVFYNTDAAFLVARTVTNFIGNAGQIRRFGWRLFPFFRELRLEKLGADMFADVPGMEGRFCERHGAEGDTVIGRAVVTGKYIAENGEHRVKFALWAETLDGEIIQTCPVEAALPSRND